MEHQTYQRVKVAIAIPTAGLIRAATVFGLCKIIGTLATTKIFPETTEQSLTMLMREGSGIGSNRQKMVDEALELDCTHILFIDDDMDINEQAFLSIARRRMPIVSCNYRMRFPPAEFTALHLDRSRGRMATTEASSGLEPCDYAGFGLSFIEMRVFKALKPPYFMNRYVNGVYTTEDLPFYWAARDAGFTAYIDQDASKMIGHIGIQNYRWDRDYPIPPEKAQNYGTDIDRTKVEAAETVDAG